VFDRLATTHRITGLLQSVWRFPGQRHRSVRCWRCVTRQGACHRTGDGTSLAGNAIGGGLVLDLSAKIVLSTRKPAQVVEPGVILSELAAAVEAHTDGNLTCARDPSSKSRATTGGSVGT
jgi:hypothetical protein